MPHFCHRDFCTNNMWNSKGFRIAGPIRWACGWSCSFTPLQYGVHKSLCFYQRHENLKRSNDSVQSAIKNEHVVNKYWAPNMAANRQTGKRPPVDVILFGTPPCRTTNSIFACAFNTAFVDLSPVRTGSCIIGQWATNYYIMCTYNWITQLACISLSLIRFLLCNVNYALRIQMSLVLL